MSIVVTELGPDYEIGSEAGVEVVLLPTSIQRTSEGQEYAVYAASTTSVLKLLKSNSVPARLWGRGAGKMAYLECRSSEWFGPTIMITSLLLSQNPTVVNVAINLISSYIYDIFRGRTDDPTARCTFAYVGKGGKKKLYYEGPTSGLAEIQKVIEELENGGNHI